jgi:hypothetical protein
MEWSRLDDFHFFAEQLLRTRWLFLNVGRPDAGEKTAARCDAWQSLLQSLVAVTQSAP